ncbi:MAG: hypothetical protein ACT4QF_19645 [Sporichthyaceae bacterium]
MYRSRIAAVATGATVAILGSCLPSAAQAQVTTGVQTLESTRIAYRMSVDPTGVPTGDRDDFSRNRLKAKHNQGLLVRYPAGFKVQDCDAPAEFHCSYTDSLVAFSRKANSRSFAHADRFEVKLRAPGIRGIYRTPALQVYSNGEEVLWNGSEADPFPAPTVGVEGRNRAPRVATGEFELIDDVEKKIACPKHAVTYAKQRRIDPARYCAFAGYSAPSFPTPSAATAPTGSASFGAASMDAAAVPVHGGSGSDELEGTARLVRSENRTRLTVEVEGLDPGKAYFAHLHEGTCAETTSPHYRNNVYGPSIPPNELWPSTKSHDRQAGLLADRNGKATGKAKAWWKARPEARSVWIHTGTVPTAPNAGGHASHERLACADLA